MEKKVLKITTLVLLTAFLIFTTNALAQPNTLWMFNATDEGLGGIVQGGITIADVDDDGLPDILAGSGDQWVYCLNGDGSKKWVFGPTYNRNIKAPQVADINQDGMVEVVICDDKGGVWALAGRDGSLIWTYSTLARTRNTAAIWDVNNDGRMEVIVPSKIGATFCLDGIEGYPIWNATIGSGDACSPVVVDIEGDGDWEIILNANGQTWLLDGSDGSVIWNASIAYAKAVPNEAPAVYDADGDGLLDIAMCGGKNLTLLSGDGRTILWSIPDVGKTTSGVLVTDVNLDGRDEIVLTTYDRTGSASGSLMCYDAITGQLLWNFDWPGRLRYSNPAAVDITGDGQINLLVGSLDGSFLAVDGLTGIERWNLTIGDDVASNPAVADIDSDGRLEIVIGCHDGNIYALDTPVACQPNEIKWGQFHGDATNNGYVPVAEGVLPAFLPLVIFIIGRKAKR
jgi:outer membrane protein assembly factor BamB